MLMTYGDLCIIEKMWNAGEPVVTISKAVGRTKMTIYNVVRSGQTGRVCANGRDEFSAELSARVRYINRLRSKQAKAVKAAEN